MSTVALAVAFALALAALVMAFALAFATLAAFQLASVSLAMSAVGEYRRHSADHQTQRQHRTESPPDHCITSCEAYGMLPFCTSSELTAMKPHGPARVPLLSDFSFLPRRAAKPQAAIDQERKKIPVITVPVHNTLNT